MRKLFKNPLEVKETDNFGTAALKGLWTGYFKGALATGAAFGVVTIVGLAINSKVKSEKKEMESKEIDKDENVVEFKVEELEAKLN